MPRSTLQIGPTLRTLAISCLTKLAISGVCISQRDWDRLYQGFCDSLKDIRDITIRDVGLIEGSWILSMEL